jgi:hypothetical protein
MDSWALIYAKISSPILKEFQNNAVVNIKNASGLLAICLTTVEMQAKIVAYSFPKRTLLVVFHLDIPVSLIIFSTDNRF